MMPESGQASGGWTVVEKLVDPHRREYDRSYDRGRIHG
jgi:hypothetical protein